MGIKCLMNGLEVNYPCSPACALFGDCVTAFEANKKASVRTNADRIRAMTDEELAEWIGAVSPYEEYCGCCPAEGFCNTSYKGMECKDIVSLWLQQPCGGADHA